MKKTIIIAISSLFIVSVMASCGGRVKICNTYAKADASVKMQKTM